MTQEEAHAIVDKALESGSLKQRNLITTITGIMGAGKTCFLRQLFGLKPLLIYSSTGVVEKSFRGLMHHVAIMDSFQILSHNKVHELLAPFLSSVANVTSMATSTSNNGEEEGSDIQNLSDIHHSSSVPYSSSNSPTTAQFTGNFESKSFNDLMQSVAPSVKSESASLNMEGALVPKKSFASEAISFALRAKITSLDTCLQLLHVIDTGGQPEFMETMPCVLHNSNLTALILNIAQRLDEPPKVTLHRNGKGFTRIVPFPLTNRQIIENLARTMQAKRCILKNGHKSKLMVIFTHYDRLWPWRIASTIAAVNVELKKIFIPAFQNELIVYRSVDEIGFPVNCRSPGAKDKIVFQQIRENMSKVNVGNEVVIPPSFLMFEHDLMRYAKELERDILTFTECVQVGVHLKMSETVVKAALIYFHQHNIFLYFPSVLPQLVFTDPQVPLNFVNNVVAFSYLVNSGEFAGLPARYSLSLKNGIVLKEMLTEEPMSSCFVPGIYESDQAIALFTHLCVIAEINDDDYYNHEFSSSSDSAADLTSTERKFLMPCMLPIVNRIGRFLPRSAASQLVVRFNNDCVPNGVFGGSIAMLLSVYRWKICKKEDGSPQCMTHDIVTLHDPQMPTQVTYLNATRHCEIHVNTADIETCADVCPLIQSTIFYALQSTFEVMHFDCTIEAAFLCTCSVSSTLAHAAIPCNFKGRVHLKCSISGVSLGLAEERQTVWLPPLQWLKQKEERNAANSVQVSKTLNDDNHMCSAKPQQPLQGSIRSSSTEVQISQKKKDRLASTDDKPTLPELIDFKTHSGSVNIIQEIGIHYHQLGPLLLKDDTGCVTEAIENQYHRNATLINREILKRWLGGTGLKPIQWSTLISVLEKIELSTLGQKIFVNLQ